MSEVALAKLEMVGLSPDDAEKFPAELSGGMIKRNRACKGASA